MKKLLSFYFDSIKLKKKYFIFLLLLALIAIVLAIFASLGYGGSESLSLDNIAYIKFLRAEIGFVSFIFQLCLNLIIFCFVILFGFWKKFLRPIAFIFYMYFVYSQIMVLIDIILVYGFFNCIIFEILLLLFIIIISLLLILLILELLQIGCINFCCCFSLKKSKILILILTILAVALAFVLLLTILKSFVILLVF